MIRAIILEDSPYLLHGLWSTAQHSPAAATSPSPLARRVACNDWRSGLKTKLRRSSICGVVQDAEGEGEVRRRRPMSAAQRGKGKLGGGGQCSLHRGGRGS